MIKLSKMRKGKKKKGKLALVMKGGGVKGLAYVGALEVLKDHYSFDIYVGTSAGAITAAFLGAEIELKKIEDLLRNTDFESLLKEERLPKLILNLFTK